MSKLIDKLTHLGRGGAPSLGFRPRKADTESGKMLLIARFSPANAEAMMGKLAGADAGLVTVSEEAPAVELMEELCKSPNDILWGCWLGDIPRANIESLTGAGSDFIVFSAVDTPLEIVDHGQSGRILEVDSSINDGLLRSVNSLPVDAVLVSEKEKRPENLNWEHLMLFRRFADLLIKPLLVTIPAKITAGELQALLDAGVKGVVVELTEKTPAGSLKNLRALIDGLKAPSPAERDKRDAILPASPGRETPAEPEMPDIEEEEE